MALPRFHSLEALTVPAPTPHTQTATRRVVIYASFISGIFFAAVLLSIHRKLQDPGNHPFKAPGSVAPHVGLLVVVLWSACGGGGTTTPPPHNAGTPARTYTVVVTATVPAAPNLSHTIQLTLTVD